MDVRKSSLVPPTTVHIKADLEFFKSMQFDKNVQFDKAVQQVIDAANTKRTPQTGIFNDMELTANPGEDKATVAARFNGRLGEFRARDEAWKVEQAQLRRTKGPEGGRILSTGGAKPGATVATSPAALAQKLENAQR